MCIDRLKTHKHPAKHPHSLTEERPHVLSTCSQRRYTYGPNKTQLQFDPLPFVSNSPFGFCVEICFCYLFASHIHDLNRVFSLIFIVQRNDATHANTNALLRKQTVLSTQQTSKKIKKKGRMHGRKFSFCYKSVSLTLFLFYFEPFVTVMAYFYLWQPKPHFEFCFERKEMLGTL